MQNSSDLPHAAELLLAENQRAVTRYYKLATGFLLAVMIIHVVLAAVLVCYGSTKGVADVGQMIVFNATLLIIEVLLVRVAFMLGSRSGQLRDMRLILLVLGKNAEPAAFEAMARAIMALRRESSSLKVVDVETLASLVKK